MLGCWCKEIVPVHLLYSEVAEPFGLPILVNGSYAPAIYVAAYVCAMLLFGTVLARVLNTDHLVKLLQTEPSSQQYVLWQWLHRSYPLPCYQSTQSRD
jgi:hypothetical protein